MTQVLLGAARLRELITDLAGAQQESAPERMAVPELREATPRHLNRYLRTRGFNPETIRVSVALGRQLWRPSPRIGDSRL
jgi:hypothetical protein